MVLNKIRNHGKILFFLWVGVRKVKGFSPLVLSSGREGVGQNWNRKDSLADRRSVSAKGGL
jgi:hypothetical protein